MDILLMASEAVPYSKTGGVAEIVHGLARELINQHHRVRIVIPCYRGMLNREKMAEIVPDLRVSLGTYIRRGSIWKTQQDELTFYFVRCDYYFGRVDYYGYLDDYERFVFFSRAALEMLVSQEFQSSQGDWFPQMILGYDWQCGLVPGWLPQYEKKDPRFSDSRFILMIHNIGKMGVFGTRALRVAEQETPGLWHQEHLAPQHVNFLLRGLCTADRVVTVNPVFDPTNPLPETAKILAPLITNLVNEGQFIGVPNAIDYATYNPERDPLLFSPFSEWNLRDRVRNKLALQHALGLTENETLPLVGMVGRGSAVKGFDLFPALKHELFDPGDFQFVLLADSLDPEYIKMFQAWENEWRDLAKGDGRNPWVRFFFDFDQVLARRIYAGSDILLLPSRQEPCGIQQFIAMHYGAVPVAHATGVLSHSIQPYQPGKKVHVNQHQEASNGFLFDTYDGNALAEAIRKALHLYRQDPLTWTEIQRYNMREDFSWHNPALRLSKEFTLLGQQPRRPIEPGEPLNLQPNEQLLQAIMEIDGLPGLASRDIQELLQQAARLVRETIQCDAVYVWALREENLLSASSLKFLDLQLVSESLDRSRRPDRPALKDSTQDMERLVNLLSQGANKTWQQSADTDMRTNVCPITGIEESTLASQENWAQGYFVPIISHSRGMGRIDALFTQEQAAKINPSWLPNALATLASSFGFRLDALRLSLESDQILKTDFDLLKAASVEEAVDHVLNRARQITHADEVWLYLRKGDNLEPFHDTRGSPAALSQAHLALASLQTMYIPDSRMTSGSEKLPEPYRSLVAVPLVRSPYGSEPSGEGVGVLVAVHTQAAAFSRDQESALRKLASQAAAALTTTRYHEQRYQTQVTQLSELSGALISSKDRKTLMEAIVKTISKVIKVDAATLYLVNEDNKRLEIQAAFGYQEPLVEAKAFYEWDEGVTGRIAAQNKPFLANDLDTLRQEGGSPKGKYDDLQEGKRPVSFYGMPLRVEGKDTPIGVLKVENLSARQFSEEDVLLITMMGNVIATVVYNAQLVEKRLNELSENLGKLSGVLVGSQNRQALMKNIVNTTAKVLNADAATLYLVNEDNKRLEIQAAFGYQEPLVEAGAFYEWGKGVTGRIAAQNKPFLANDTDTLRQEGGSPKGKYDDLQGGKRPISFYGMPLNVEGKEYPIGVLKVENLSERQFSDQDVLLITMMGNVIATVVYNAQLGEQQLRRFSTNLRKLSGALIDSSDRSFLMQRIVNTIGEVLNVDAATLYLVNEDNKRLEIQAAYGYQEPLVEARAFYEWGKGVTGRIAAQNKPFLANDLNTLRREGGSPKGKYDDLQGDKRPASFYGMPLRVEGKDTPIGVLKVENVSQRQFSEEDVLLITMMGNTIATVVYNTRYSEQRLEKLSANLGQISDALTGTPDIYALMKNIVNTTANVLNVDAATLYLVNEDNKRLEIQAAFGYQEPLVDAKAFYEWDEGVTGRIAAQNKPFLANDLDTLRQEGGSPKGKYDDLQGGMRPISFYGMPLNVEGKEYPIGVLKVENLSPRHFTAEDVLLISVMGKMITTVVYNAKLEQERRGTIMRTLGTFSQPRSEAAQELLLEFATSPERGILNLLTQALLEKIDDNNSAAYEETLALLKAGARPELVKSMADSARSPSIHRRFELFYRGILKSKDSEDLTAEHMEQVIQVTHLWVSMEEQRKNPATFKNAVTKLMKVLGDALQAPVVDIQSKGRWVGVLLDTSRTFANTYLPDKLAFAFHPRGAPQEEDLPDLTNLLTVNMKNQSRVVLPMWCDRNILERTRTLLRNKFQQVGAIDTVILDIDQAQDIVAAVRPEVKFHHVVLSQISLARIDPYVNRGPTTQPVFFGRENELREITQKVAQANFAIIGGRRYGKTSILNQLYEVRLPKDTFHLCMKVGHSRGCYTELLALLKKMPKDLPLVLLLDEADTIIEQDAEKNWELFNHLRALSNEHKAHFILAGERQLRNAIHHDSKSPLFNLANEVPLGPLDFHSVQELVLSPMKQLELEFEDEQAIVNAIWQFTAGHPSVVQSLCKRLIRRLNDQGLRRITLEDVQAVIEDRRFQQEDFLETYWEQATPLEVLITLLMAGNEQLRNQADIGEALKQRCHILPTAQQVDEALTRLVVLRAILVSTSGGYQFKVPAFPRVAAGMIQFENPLEIYADKFRKVGE